MTLPQIVRRPLADPAPGLLPDLHPVLRRIYLARRISDPGELDLSLRRLLSPQGLGGLERAVAVLSTALAEGRSIQVMGDYDADGATASALAVTALRALGAEQVDYQVPDRFKFGYGLSVGIVDLAVQRGADLLLTVDNGIGSLRGVAHARELGLQVIVTDHHLPGEALPAADAIVNPNLPGDPFPSKHAAGVGVVFYLLSALRSHLRALGWFRRRGIAEPNLAELLDLVALGTVADVVPLDRNNRILVHQGLRRIRAGRCRPGIMALLQAAQRLPHRVTAGDLAFSAAPRLNAAGRLDDMRLGIECLLADDLEQARRQAVALNDLNQARRSIEDGMRLQAEAMLDRLTLHGDDLPLGLCLFDPDWHQGVIGILAARIKERHNRPVVALAAAEDGTLKGSARSITDLHLRDLLAAVNARHPGLILRFGGHAMAAGLTLERSRLEPFARAFDAEVSRRLGGALPGARILTDGELAPHEMDLAAARALRFGGPWGQGFPEPLFDGEFRVLSHRFVGEIHLRMALQAAPGCILEAIAFRWGPRPPPAGRVRVVYRMDLNEFRGVESLQLIVEHLEPL
jgi:single-stranded-DNA-specific exonuclease